MTRDPGRASRYGAVELWAVQACVSVTSVRVADPRGCSRGWGPPGFTCPPSSRASPRLDRREKLRVRLMPSQLPGSSLMMPTLVFQVVQFTSSTLQGEEMGQQGAGGPQPRGPSAPADQGGETQLVRGGPGGACLCVCFCQGHTC